jgi:hypothetical protein
VYRNGTGHASLEAVRPVPPRGDHERWVLLEAMVESLTASGQSPQAHHAPLDLKFNTSVFCPSHQPGVGMYRCSVAILWALLLSASLCTQVRAQSDTTFFRKNGWTGSVLTAKSGTFGCLIRTEFTARMGFGLIQLHDGKWMGAFSRVGGFQRGMRWDMELLVDGKSIHRGVAAVGDTGLAILEPALAARAVTALSTGQKLEVVTIRGRFEYALTGSADAIEAAQTCVQYLNNNNPTAGRATSGTGFFITIDGKILTNAHVVRGCTKIEAGLPGRRCSPCA